MSGVKRIVPVMLLALAVFVSGELARVAGLPPDSTPDCNGTLKLKFSMPLLSLDPYSGFYGAKVELLPFIYSFLLVPSRDGGFSPDLALRWWSENDETVWSFVLRPDARFHDGRPVTGADAAYSVEELLSIYPYLAEAVETVDVPAPDKIVIRLRRRVPEFLYQLSTACLIVPRPKPGEPSAGSQAAGRPTVGSGPFRVRSRDGDRHLMLERFEDYYLGAPCLKGIDIAYEPDKEKIWMDFMHDEIQASWAVSPENAWFMRIDPVHYQLEGSLSSNVTLILLNLKDDLFADRLTRRALGKMLDVDHHIEQDLKGMAVKAPGPLGVFSPYQLPETERFGRNWEEAERLLKEAGWKDGGDGYLERNGRKFEFNLLVPVMFQMERETAVYIQRAFNQFGIKAHLVYKRYDRILDENLKPGSFQACLTQFSTNPKIPWALGLYWSSSPGNVNFGGYRSETAERAIDLILQGAPEDQTERAYQALNEQLARDQPAIWLYHTYQIHGFSIRLQGLERPNRFFYVTYPLVKTWLSPEQK